MPSRLWLLAMLMATLAIGAAVWPLVGRHRERAHYRACLTNIQQVAMAMRYYAQDFDAHLPIASAYPQAIMAHATSTAGTTLAAGLTPRSFVCPSDHRHAMPGYALVQRWAGVELEKIDQPSCAALLYDADGSTPSYRHFGEFCDGHGQRLKGLCVGYCDGRVGGSSRTAFTQRNIEAGRDDDYVISHAGE